jgi:ABC-type phosphate transport system substrate-binding protein
MLRSLVALGAVAVTVTALAVPALADPVNSHGKAVTPKSYDIVGVGSDTDDTLLDQLSVDYNAAHPTHSKTHPWIYSWDATPPGQPTNVTSKIATKSGCAKILRPDGTGAGLTAFETPVKDGSSDCIDFARAASPRTTTDPPKGPNGVLYVRLAEDAATYATNATTNAPAAGLTTAQLVAIFGTCTITNWSQVGGKSGKIDPVLPPSSTGTTKFFLKALGGITAGPCVDKVSPQQNEGIEAPIKNNPNALVPYSVGKYIAQVHHDAACGKKPTKSQNAFGCDEHGKLVLGKINKTAPTVGTGANTKINAKFPVAFLRPLYDVVFWAKTADNIPTRLQPIFAAAHAKVPGWFCANKTATKAIASYGFLTSPLCGFGS